MESTFSAPPSVVQSTATPVAPVVPVVPSNVPAWAEPILHWVAPFLSAGVGLLATWLYTNIPGIHVFGSGDAIANALAAGVVFVVSAGLAWLSHQKAVVAIVKKLES
jgi:hypothetical protein